MIALVVDPGVKGCEGGYVVSGTIQGNTVVIHSITSTSDHSQCKKEEEKEFTEAELHEMRMDRRRESLDGISVPSVVIPKYSQIVPPLIHIKQPRWSARRWRSTT